jgi:hypothetical protein
MTTVQSSWFFSSLGYAGRSDEKSDPLAIGPAPGQRLAEILAASEQAGSRSLNGRTVRDLLLERGLSGGQVLEEVLAR